MACEQLNATGKVIVLVTVVSAISVSVSEVMLSVCQHTKSRSSMIYVVVPRQGR